MPPANRYAARGVNRLATGDLENRLRDLPEDLRRQILDYMEFLLSRHPAGKARARKFRFDWAGALAGYAGRYTAVELQHKASEWR
ncbi:MAG: DUF2281 domain-containing protein [Euryarchaeota archaeon]|nr:DUF2281 domain-containing protein [Euryarchaeota archaeon]